MSTITYHTRTIPYKKSGTGIWEQSVLKNDTLLPFPTDQQTADGIHSMVLSAIWLSDKGESQIQHRVCVEALPDGGKDFKGDLSIEKDVTTRTFKSLADSGPLWVAAEGNMNTDKVDSLHEVNRNVLSQVKPSKLSVDFQSISKEAMEKLTGMQFTTELHHRSVGERITSHITKSNSHW